MVETLPHHTPPPPNHHQVLVLKSAICSRLLLVTLIILFRTLVSPYDTSASLNPPCLSTPNPNSTTHPSPLENGVVWDSVYFLRIAQCGYEYEQTFAFLPLLPLSASFFLRGRVSLAFLLKRLCLMFLCDLVFGFCDGRYSESLHAFLCFGGMYHFVSGGNVRVLMACWMLATSVFRLWHRAYHAVFHKSVLLLVSSLFLTSYIV